MRTATIILPKPANGNIKAHDYLKFRLLDRFGGYSEYSGNGAWKDNTGKVFTEPHIRYEVAFNDDSYSASWEVIKSLAINAGGMQGEQAVFVQIDNWAEILNAGV